MNFSTSTRSRNPVLRAGLKGTTFSTSLIVKPDLVSNTNNNINPPGTNNFLTISKSRVPDIQMINKYYGLVPKKFVITARSDYSSKQSTKLLRARTAQSFDEEISQSLLDERIVSKGKIKIKEIHDDSAGHVNSGGHTALQRSGSIGGGSDTSTTTTTTTEDKTQADVDELVARKMSVEKHKKSWKRIKDCGRSLSMMDNCENMGTTMGSHKNKDGEMDNSLDRLDIQRVIKIDLNNMKWEESYKEKSKTDGRERERGSSALPTTTTTNSNSNTNITTTTTTTTAMEALNNTKNNLNHNNNSNHNHSDHSGCSSAGGKTKRGFLRKTISFDEQIMRNSIEAVEINDTDKVEPQKLPRRPMTASVRSSVTMHSSSPSPPASTPVPKLSAWTNRNSQNSTERRLKFARSFSIYQGSVDNGESENELELSEMNNQSNSSSSFLSQRLRESRKSLHVQPPPEISTMISLMNPPPVEEDLQSEIDKVASIIDDVHSMMAQVDVKLSPDESTSKALLQTSDMTSDSEGNVITELPQENSTGEIAESVSPTDISTLTSIQIPNPNPTPSDDEPPTASHLFGGRRVLKKAASISCENELLPRDPPEGFQGKQVSQKIRPQTSKAKSTVSFANTTNMRLIPPRSKHSSPPNPNSNSLFSISSSSSGGSYSTNSSNSTNSTLSISNDAAGSASSSSSENSQSQASKNRKILIKKALIEINQSSIHLGRKLNHTRPKTAPTPEKKNPPLSTHHPSQKRQPLKVRSPPIKPIGSLRKSSTLNSKMESRNSKEGSPEPVKESSPTEPEPEPSPPKVRVMPRQSFSVIDSVLHGFGPDFHDDGVEDGGVVSSFVNSKKREECLKIYEKMMKKGCPVKLETIFRGMMTPSEYRLFLQDTEMAEKKAMEATVDENVTHGDAGISMVQGSGAQSTN